MALLAMVKSYISILAAVIGCTTRQDAQLELERFWVGSLRKAVVEGDVEYGSVMAGQAVGLMDKITTVNEVIHEIMADGEAALQEMKNFFAE